jgi:iron-sulfur cluster repair protein YtfE (RIC family)
MLRPKSQKLTREDDLLALLLDCHERIRRFAALARTAGERGNAPEAQVVDACASVERYFTQALPLHVQDEEESILPRLRGLAPEVDRALDDMASQHTAHALHLPAMLAASASVRAEPSAPDRRAALAEVAVALEQELESHLQLEETVIFPAIRALLPAAVQAEIVKELRARRSP